MRLPSLLVLLAAALSFGCSSPSAFSPCSGDVTVSVVRLNPPKISWEPGCGVDILVVEDGAARTMWSIRSGRGENTLVPPITYGVPGGAIEEFSPQQFQHGNGYVVRLYRLKRESDGTQLGLLAGQGNFRW